MVRVLHGGARHGAVVSPYRQYHVLDPRRHYLRSTAGLGRRGTVLALLGIVWIAQGLTVLLAPSSPTYYLLANFEPARAIGWIATGVVAVAYAARPQGDDAPGFLSLYVMAAYRVVAYSAGFVAWMIPGGVDGNPRGIVGIFSWFVILLAIVVIAGWHEPSRRRSKDAA